MLKLGIQWDRKLKPRSHGSVSFQSLQLPQLLKDFLGVGKYLTLGVGKYLIRKDYFLICSTFLAREEFEFKVKVQNY